MGADLIVHLVCDAKKALGDGDPLKGTVEALGMLKARSRALYVAQRAREQGIKLEDASITVVRRTPEGEEHVEWKVVDMMAHAAPLEAYKNACVGCPANLKNEPFGCVVYVGYPITPDAERWVMDRAETAGELGRKLLLRALADFGYDGAPIDGFRKQGLFEASGPIVRRIEDTEVRSNQIFHAVFAVGNHLDPFHCMGVLLWLGMLEVDGVAPEDLRYGHLQALVSMSTRAERARRVTLRIERDSDPDVQAVQLLFRSIYSAFCNGVPLLVDA